MNGGLILYSNKPSNTFNASFFSDTMLTFTIMSGCSYTTVLVIHTNTRGRHISLLINKATPSFQSFQPIPSLRKWKPTITRRVLLSEQILSHFCNLLFEVEVLHAALVK